MANLRIGKLERIISVDYSGKATKIGTISLLDSFVVFSKYSLFFLILNRFDGKKCMLYVENFSMRGRTGKDGGRFLRGNGV